MLKRNVSHFLSVFTFFIKILSLQTAYLKSATPEGLSRARNTWIFIGSSLLVLLVILLLIAFLTLGFTKRKRVPNAGVVNKRQVFDEEGSGCDNHGFVAQEIQKNKKKKEESPTYINFRHQASNQTIKSGILRERPRSTSSCSTLRYTSSVIFIL